MKRQRRTIRAAFGVHCLSAGALAGSPVGKLTNEQINDTVEQLRHEVKRMRGLENDAAVKLLELDLVELHEELERREVCL